MYGWKRFDICEAWYLYASQYHSGQGSKLYAKLSQLARIKFRPSPILKFKTLSPNGKEIYHALLRNKTYYKM